MSLGFGGASKYLVRCQEQDQRTLILLRYVLTEDSVKYQNGEYVVRAENEE